MKTVLCIALSFAGLFGFARGLDYASAVNAVRLEQATGHTYASICARGISDACPIASSIAFWGVK